MADDRAGGLLASANNADAWENGKTEARSPRDQGGRGDLAPTKTNPLTAEEAMEMPLEEIEQIVAEDASGYFKPIEELEPWVRRSQELDPPRGGLPGGMMGPLGKALESVLCEKGEHVIENVVSRFGVCRLRMMRLGKAIEPKLYMDQITARDRVSGLQAWAWEEKNAGQETHVLLLVWCEGRES